MFTGNPVEGNRPTAVVVISVLVCALLLLPGHVLGQESGIQGMGQSKDWYAPVQAPFGPVLGRAVSHSGQVTGSPTPVRDRWWNITSYLGPCPAPRVSALFGYDPIIQGAMLIGGIAASNQLTPLLDAWEYHGGSWTNLTSRMSTLPPTEGGLMTYDARDGYFVVFGGRPVGASQDTNGTYALDGTNWTNLSGLVPGAPPPASSSTAEMAFDAAMQAVVLVEYTRIPTSTGGDALTWTYANGTWTNITATSGAPDIGVMAGDLAFDERDGYLLQFGGYKLSPSGTEVLENHTWTFANDSWREANSTGLAPTPRLAASMDYDPQLGGLILVGGWENMSGGTSSANLTYGNDTWEYSGGNWTNISVIVGPQGPPRVPSSAMTYDAVDGVLLYLGTSGESNYTLLLGNPAPIARVTIQPGVVEVNQTFGVVVSATAGTAPYTLHYASTFAGCPQVPTWAMNCTARAQGSFSIEVTITDSTNRSVNASAALTVTRGLTVEVSASPSALHVGEVTWIATSVLGGSSPYVVDFGSLPPGCSPPATIYNAFSCVPGAPGLFRLNVTASDAAGLSAQGHVTVQAFSSLMTPLLRVTSSELDFGDSVEVITNVTGGAPPLTYEYSGLPTGCLGVNGPALSCTPSTTGTYRISAEVVDALGSAANSSDVTIRVEPSPLIRQLTITPNETMTGHLVNVTVSVGGGTPPFVLSWSGLPPGCSPNGTAFSCTPTQPGEYAVRVNATDARGQSAIGESDLAVEPIAQQSRVNLPVILWAGASIAVLGGIVAIFLSSQRRKRVKGI